jgi:membrane-associated protease RseP (regulator of RpoE activity)
VRPERNSRGPATIQAICKTIDEAMREEDGPRAYFADVREGGWAHQAGIETGDQIIRCAGVDRPTAAQVNREIRANANERIRIEARKADGKVIATSVVPRRPGSIDAQYNLVADDLLIVGGIVETLQGKPSPAALSGLTPGSRIQTVNGESVSRWRDLIEAFRLGAGTDVKLGFVDAHRQPGTTAMPVPHCLRTRLGVGPEARIVSINGQKKVMIETSRGREEAAVGYRKATQAVLTELIGSKRVPVEFRANPLAPLETGYVDVTEDMVDPWLGRIAFSANIDVAPETTLLKGDNALDAVWIGVHKTYYFIVQVYKILERMVFTRSVSVDSVSGPLGIIDLGGEFARSGFVRFVFFLAIISANLAVINFLPLPIVDGGLMVFLIIEKIKGSPVSLRVQVATQMIGLFLIIGAFLYVTFNDAMRLWG